MSSKNRNMMAILLAGWFSVFATSAFAQSSQSGQGGQSGQQPNPPNKGQKPAESGSTLEIPGSKPPVSAEEEAAAKAFQAMPNTDVPKKIEAGEQFLKK